jgi:hypothetical protein
MPNALTSGKPIPVWYYGAGAGVLFIAYYFYSSSKKKKAAAALAPMAAATTASQTPVVPAGSYGTGVDAGSLNNIETQLQNLNAAQAQTQGSASSSGVTASASQWGNLQGSGFTGGGSQYANIKTNEQMQAILANNLERYYEPVPGLFEKVTGKEATGTPQFVKVS